MNILKQTGHLIGSKKIIHYQLIHYPLQLYFPFIIEIGFYS